MGWPSLLEDADDRFNESIPTANDAASVGRRGGRRETLAASPVVGGLSLASETGRSCSTDYPFGKFLHRAVDPESGQVLRWRWQLELGGRVVARIVDTGRYDGVHVYGEIVDSPEFERYRAYHTNYKELPDDAPALEALEALCDEVRSKGEFVLHDLRSNWVKRFAKLGLLGGQLVRFRVR